MFSLNKIKTTAIALCVIVISSIAVIAGPTNVDNTLELSSDSFLQHNNELVFINDVNHINNKTLTLTNPSDQEIIVEVRQSLKTPFSYKGKYAVKIPANSEKELEFKFHPMFSGRYSSSVKLYNKTEKTEKTIQLTGYTSDSVPFPISVNSDKINFEKVILENTSTVNLELHNLSQEPQLINLSSDNPDFTIANTIELSASSSTKVPVKFSAKQLGENTANIQIYHIDKNQTETVVDVKLTATVINKAVIKKANFVLDKSYISFYNSVGTQTMKTTKIKNTGNTNLKLELANQIADVKVIYPSEIPANQTKEIKVIYNPSYNQNKKETLNFENNSDQELKIELGLTANGGSKYMEKTQIKFDKKVYKATRNNKGTFKLYSNHNALVNVLIKKDGSVIKNLGIYEIAANTHQTIHWNGRNERNELVQNDTYMLVAKGLNAEDNFTHSAQIKTNFGKPKYTASNNLAETVYQATQYYKNFSENIHLASIQTQCEGRIYINILVKGIDQDYKLKLPHQACNELYHLQIPDFLEQGNYPYEIQLRKQHLIQTIKGNLEIIDINQTVTDINFNTNQTPSTTAFEASLSQNIANTQQNIYVQFTNRRHGYINARISGKNLKKDVYLARYMPVVSGLYEKGLTIEKQSLNPGIYTLHLDFLQDNLKLEKNIEFIIIEQTPEQQTYGFLDTFKNNDCGEFTDINKFDTFCQKLEFANQQELISSQKEYQPNNKLKRAEAAALTIRLLGVTPRGYSKVLDSNLGYKDLNIDAWYMPYMKMIIKSNTVNQAQNSEFVRRILQGYSDQTMRPEASINRAEFYKIFFEAAKNSNKVTLNVNIDYNPEAAPFKDTPLNKDTLWYLPYAELVQQNLSGTEFARLYFKSKDLNSNFAKFQPYKKVTRKEVIDLIYTLAELNLINF